MASGKASKCMKRDFYIPCRALSTLFSRRHYCIQFKQINILHGTSLCMITGEFFGQLKHRPCARRSVISACVNLRNREPGGGSLLGALVVAVCCKCVVARVDGLESVARVR
jgi:hypothetical protein